MAIRVRADGTLVDASMWPARADDKGGIGAGLVTLLKAAGLLRPMLFGFWVWA